MESPAPTGHDATNVVSSTFTVLAEDHHELGAYSWLSGAGDSPDAVIQVVHGMAEHAARYGRLATRLVQAGLGYAVYAHDHRGHGRSIAPGEEAGHFADSDGWNLAVRDVHRVNREIHKRHPGKPIILLGHSMGSFMVQQLLFEHPECMVAAAMSGSNGKPPALAQAGRLLARIERARLGPRGQSSLMHKLSFEDFNKPFEPARTPYDWISRDPDEVEKYQNDPLCGFQCSVQVWLDMLDALGKLTAPENVARIPKDMPIYIFSGSDDPVGGERGAKSLAASYRAAWMTDVELKIYPGGRHEMLNDTQRDEVTSDLVRWLRRVDRVRRH